MRAFYGDRFSPHMTRTPEGFLICHEVPIARTGTQDYLPRELGLEGTGLIKVKRNEEDVFSLNAITSFEGKPVTDEHPKQDISSANYANYMRGVVQNVHRNKNYLVADLVIHDANLIAEIEAGKREISCGYDCKYVRDGDSYKQIDIIGNHVAVVNNGRAGKTVSIKDEKPKGEKKMPKKSIFKKMFDAFVKDAEPDEIQEAAKAVDEVEETKTSDPPKVEDEDGEEKATKADVEELAETVDSLAKTVDSFSKILLAQSGRRATTLDELEEELKEEQETPPEEVSDDEEEVSKDPEEISEDEEPEEVPEETSTKDKAVALAAIRAVKPIIASLPASQRRKAADSMNRAIRNALKINSTTPLDSYSSMTRRKTTDAASSLNERKAFGENCRKRNPHYKGE